MKQVQSTYYLLGYCLLFLVATVLFHFMFVQQDTTSFVAAIKLAVGEAGANDRLFRLTKPVGLIVPILFYQLGISAIYALWIQQLLCILLFSYFIFQISKIISSTKQAWVAVFVTLLCQPVAVYGLAALVDMAGWAFMVGVVCLLLKYQEKWTSSLYLIGLGVVLGIGIFIKESVLLAGVFIFFSLMYAATPLWLKLKQYLLIGASFLVTLAIGSVLTWHYWQETIYHWVLFNQDTPPASNLYYIVLQTYRTLDVFWFLVAIGVYKYWMNSKKYAHLTAFLSTALVGSLVFPFLWHYHYDRILFMNTIFLFPFIVLGSQLFGRFQWWIILLGGISNWLVAFGIYKYQIGGLIVLEAMLFLLMMAVFYGWNAILKKKAVNL